MSILKIEDKKKWLNAFLALASVIIGFVMMRFCLQLGEWFDLEAKIPNFTLFIQAIGVLTGLIAFIVAVRHQQLINYLDEVYSELIKVIWPEQDSTIKLTIGIIVGTTIVSGIFVLVDFIFSKLLSLIY